MSDSGMVYPLRVPVGPRDGLASPSTIEIVSQDYFRKTVSSIRHARKTGKSKGWISAFSYTRAMHLMKRKFNTYGLSQDQDEFDDIGGVFGDFVRDLAEKAEIPIDNIDALVTMRVLILYQREAEDVIGTPKLATLCTPGFYDLIDEGVPPLMDQKGDREKAFAAATTFSSYPTWF